MAVVQGSVLSTSNWIGLDRGGWSKRRVWAELLEYRRAHTLMQVSIGTEAVFFFF